jgi:deoxyribodipyrimidine photo-lyase
VSTGVVWFRSDLRLTDNPAWAAATAAHDRVVALFVLDPRLLAAAGSLRTNLLLAHLASLDAELGRRGGRLLVRRGDPRTLVGEVVANTGAAVVHLNHDVTPYATRRDTAVGAAVAMVVHHGRTVHPIGAITTTGGAPYRVFTPFHRAWEAQPWEPWPVAGTAAVAADVGDAVPAAAPPVMAPGEAGAAERLDRFLHHVDRYDEERDRPDLDHTSRLSADLRFGTISPRLVAGVIGDGTPGRRAFIRQLAWREFYAQVLASHPATTTRALRSEYDAIAWRDDPGGLEAWQRGLTGYPVVDAGMRQLLAEGWMHNRVRMIAASFLVKDLLIDWRAGERWFRRHLVDADVAQNVGNWQWIAGTGADAAPYFRVFNPVTQSRRFDPDGDYLRRWVPELRGLDGDAVHAPWEAGPLDLAAGGVVLDDTYPSPIVDHAMARERVITAYRVGRSIKAP